MAEVIDLIVRTTEDGLYATSPQAPGLAYGASFVAELRSDIADVLAWHFDRPGRFQVVEHHECHYEVAGGRAGDPHRARRAP